MNDKSKKAKTVFRKGLPILVAVLALIPLAAQQWKTEVLTTVKPYDDVRHKDAANLDLPGKDNIMATFWFNGTTIWPEAAKPVAEKLLKACMNPGLGVRELHAQGLTGKGVNVAIIDQPMYQDHPEFAGNVAGYFDTGCEAESSMHGPAVTSLLAGKNIGTAPDARVYFAAAPSWKGDTAYEAKALDWIIEQNRKLPAGQKIRVVSVSAAPSGEGAPRKINLGTWDEACARAEKEGILVLDCTRHRGIIGPCWYDAAFPEDVSKCLPGYPGLPDYKVLSNRVLVPASPRTSAEEYVKGQCGYQYSGRGGLSWAIPYASGVLALGWQECPSLTSKQIVDILFKSAYQREDGTKIIQPKEFIRMVKEFKKTGMVK